VIPKPSNKAVDASEPVKVIDRETSKISTYNGSETEKYNWS